MDDRNHEERVFPFYLAHIADDPSTQTRVVTDPEAVDQYAADMQAGHTFPPVILYRDPSGVVRIGDGFTRVAAARKLGKESIRAVLREGTAADAWACSIACNRRNGQRYARADLRKIAHKTLDDLEAHGKTLSTRAIAEKIGCSHSFIANLRIERNGGGVSLVDSEAELARREAALAANMPGALAFLRAASELESARGPAEFAAWMEREHGPKALASYRQMREWFPGPYPEAADGEAD